jgi:chromosomal replication initiator protein
MTQTTTDYRDQLTRGIEIIADVAQSTGIHISSMVGSSRERPIVISRHLAMFRIKDETGLPLTQIARLFGDRHHTTVMHGIKTWRDKWSKL